MRRARLSGNAAPRSDAENAPFVLWYHVFGRGLGAEKDPFEIDSHDTVPLLFRHVDNRYAIHYARAAENVIHLAVSADGLIHHGGDALRIGYVDLDGAGFAQYAVRQGAAAVVVSAEGLETARADIGELPVPFFIAENPRAELARLAAAFHGRQPATMVAVTGTNGKTSNVELCRQLWRMAGHPSASIGTLGVTTADDQVTTGLTTPDIVTFLSNMAGLERMGISHAAFEASSHGLAQYRTEGLPVRAAAFTNFSRDHLDYHGTMEAYFEAKMRLFEEVVEPDGTAVIWMDDVKSEEVLARCRARGLATLTVGKAGETLKLVARETTPMGQKLTVEADGRSHIVNLALIGAYQAANALTAAGLVIATGGGPGATLASLSRVHPVRGRLERAVLTRAGTPVYVDYAHTPDAIESAIEALRPHAKDRLIIVFGAGGDRDVGKRAEMGAAAARLAEGGTAPVVPGKPDGVEVFTDELEIDGIVVRRDDGVRPASFDAPPSGDWVVLVHLVFANGDGDGAYFWHVIVP